MCGFLTGAWGKQTDGSQPVANPKVRVRGGWGGDADVWGCAPSECTGGRVPAEGLGASPAEAVVLIHSV